MELHKFKKIKKECDKFIEDYKTYSGENGPKQVIYFQNNLKEKEKGGNKLEGKVEVAIEELKPNSPKIEEWENLKKDIGEVSDGYAAIEERVFGKGCDNPENKKE